MKNFKKISREQLKNVQGAGSLPQCPVGYIYRCEAVGVCDEISGQDDCACGCVVKPVRP
ncbi:bacteriocin-like protein [Chryseobacterium sp. T16E-39]|uniref:bacteriocin-like protein n=1 Tax=Chryseobacterium sp. T16E-39 TaxID=2015076 RepID=UPI00267D83E4